MLTLNKVNELEDFAEYEIEGDLTIIQYQQLYYLGFEIVNVSEDSKFAILKNSCVNPHHPNAQYLESILV